MNAAPGDAGPTPHTVRRAKPLLGTLVDIAVGGLALPQALASIAAAFDEVATVHRLMSRHEATSDLGRLDAAPVGRPITVDWRTAEVLAAAVGLWQDTGGAFDCTAGGPPAAEPPGWTLEGSVCIRRSPVRLDLGGIAKGYAVDRAMAVLKALGATRATVNAGGDLAHHGDPPLAVHLRDPADPARWVGVATLASGAIASSATSALGLGVGAASALVDTRRGAALPAGAGVSVAAPSCLLADALTKVVLVTGDPHHPALGRHGAQVLHHRPASTALAARPPAPRRAA